MALNVLFKNKTTFLFLYFVFFLLNLQICQVILSDTVCIIDLLIEYIYRIWHKKSTFKAVTNQWYKLNWYLILSMKMSYAKNKALFH